MIDENGSFGMGRSKKGPDQDRVYIYWLRKIDSGFCFQNQENRTLNEIIFLKKKKNSVITGIRTLDAWIARIARNPLYTFGHWHHVKGKQLLNINITVFSLTTCSYLGHYGGDHLSIISD